MLNVDVKIDKKSKIMTLIIDLNQTHGKSASGKTITIGSTKGNKTIETPDGEIVLGVNCYKYPPRD